MHQRLRIFFLFNFYGCIFLIFILVRLSQKLRLLLCVAFIHFTFLKFLGMENLIFLRVTIMSHSTSHKASSCWHSPQKKEKKKKKHLFEWVIGWTRDSWAILIELSKTIHTQRWRLVMAAEYQECGRFWLAMNVLIRPSQTVVTSCKLS